MSENPPRGGRRPRGLGRGHRGEEQLTLNVPARGGRPHQSTSSASGTQYGQVRGERGTSRGFSHEGDGRGRARGRGRGRGAPVEVEVYRAEDGVQEPDPNVAAIENETDEALQLARVKSKASIAAQMPQRPGFGTRGKDVVLWTNYFNMIASRDLLLHRYSIDVIEDQSNKAPTGKNLKRVVSIFLEEFFAEHGRKVVTDFKSNLISNIELELEPEYLIKYRAEGEDDPVPNAKSYRIRLQPTGTRTVSELMDYLTSSHASELLGSKDEILQALNIIIGQYPKDAANVASVGANKHFLIDATSQEKFDLGAGLTALRGFVVSVRAATARIIVNVQVKHGAFFNEGPLVGLMKAFMQKNGPNKFALGKFVENLTVEVIHIVVVNKARRIIPRIKKIESLATRSDGRAQTHPPIVPSHGAGSNDVKFFLGDPATEYPQDPSGPSSSRRVAGKGGKGKGKEKAGSFPAKPSTSLAQGRYISVYEYFTQNYPNIAIADPNLPVINVGNRRNPIYLPPDVCIVRPGQASNAKLSVSQAQEMIRFAVRKPVRNAQSIAINGAHLLGFDPNNDTIGAFGLNVVPKLITVPGRVLDCPNGLYRENKVAETSSGSWNMAGIKFTTRKALHNWTYLRITSPKMRDFWSDDSALEATLGRFTTELIKVGIDAGNYAPGIHISVDPSHLQSEIDDAIRTLTTNPGQRSPELILVILPSAETAIYNRVKTICDVEKGIINICVLASKFAKANSQYHANVALKVNLKLGGQNQALQDGKLGIISEGKTMVVGIDVTHPSPGSASNAPSVAGIVASIDRTLGQWPADLRVQTGRQEMVADLSSLFKSRLLLWKAKNGTFPDNILVYRDGVSEGQYNLVLEQELPELQKASEEVYTTTETNQGIPKITVVVVGKRHNTRFYPMKKEDADRFSNPHNGTVVDRGVTEAPNWDFFLQSHTAIQGTARPAHYYVVYDQIFQGREQSPFANAAEILEDLTHNMCYMFGRATKAVSICPPAYYADVLCERARCYLSGVYDPSSTSPDVSMISGETGSSGRAVDPSRVRVHDNVKDSMFYI